MPRIPLLNDWMDKRLQGKRKVNSGFSLRAKSHFIRLPPVIHVSKTYTVHPPELSAGGFDKDGTLAPGAASEP